MALTDLAGRARSDGRAVLVTDSEDLAESVRDQLEVQEPTWHAERIRTALAGEQSAIALSTTSSRAWTWSTPTPPNTSRCTSPDAWRWPPGAERRGDLHRSWAPVSLGDYSAGSTHVLPTAGCACHRPAPNVNSSQQVHVIDYSREGLSSRRSVVETFAEAENCRHEARSPSGASTDEGPDETEPEFPPWIFRCVLELTFLASISTVRPSWRCRCAWNVNENLFPPGAEIAADMAAALTAGCHRMPNRDPDSARRPACAPRCRHFRTSHDRQRLGRQQVPTR
ncbi:MAG: histidinol dehydrogenase [Micropruina sp.]